METWIGPTGPADIEEADMQTAMVPDHPSPVTTVAVGYDGSEPSLVAVRWATSFAERLDAKLTVVSAVERDYAEMSPQDAVEFLADELDRIADELGRRGLTNLVVDVREGEPDGVLAEAADAHDVLVIGSRPDAGVTRHGYLSLAHRLAHHVAHPLIVVPPSSVRWSSDRPILVGVDGSEGNHVAFDWTRDLAVGLGAPVTAVYVVNPLFDTFDSAGWYGDEEQQARREAVDVELVERPGGHPAEALVEISSERDAGLLVVGARSHLALGGYLLGSVPSELLHHHDVPVAVVSHRYEVEHG